MSKWIRFADNGLVNEKNSRREKAFRNAIKNTPKRSIEQMKKDSDVTFKESKEREESLIKAFEEKKLKSKALIKEAKGIKKVKVKKAEVNKQKKTS